MGEVALPHVSGPAVFRPCQALTLVLWHVCSAKSARWCAGGSLAAVGKCTTAACKLRGFLPQAGGHSVGGCSAIEGLIHFRCGLKSHHVGQDVKPFDHAHFPWVVELGVLLVMKQRPIWQQNGVPDCRRSQVPVYLYVYTYIYIYVCVSWQQYTCLYLVQKYYTYTIIYICICVYIHILKSVISHVSACAKENVWLKGLGRQMLPVG